jgi:fumarylpyruvate hydrolase
LELVVAIGQSGFQVEAAQAHELIYGYATGLDMTRRDLQAGLRSKGQPWDLAKDVEQSAVCSEIVPMPHVVLEQGEIALRVNGEVRQQSDIRFLIWSVREIIADLSRYYHLRAGDLIYTGTPEGVGPVQAGDVLQGHVAGVSEVCLRIEA